MLVSAASCSAIPQALEKLYRNGKSPQQLATCIAIPPFTIVVAKVALRRGWRGGNSFLAAWVGGGTREMRGRDSGCMMQSFFSTHASQREEAKSGGDALCCSKQLRLMGALLILSIVVMVDS
jgi:hypothetical protein